MRRRWIIIVAVGLVGCAGTQARSPFPQYPVLNGRAQTRRYVALQEALSHDASGHARFWSGPDRTSGRITPLETIPSAFYGWCRSYEEQIADGARRQSTIGIACRTQEAGWVVFDLRKAPVTSSR